MGQMGAGVGLLDSVGAAAPWPVPFDAYSVTGRGLHSFTSQLNLSAFNGIGGARRGCVARVKGVLGGCPGCFCVIHGSN